MRPNWASHGFQQTTARESWWVGLSREALKEMPRMRASKEYSVVGYVEWDDAGSARPKRTREAA